MNLEELIKGCRNNKLEAQEGLYKLFKDDIYITCLKYVHSEMDAEDLLKDTFLEVFQNIKKYKGSGTFEGWIKRIAINKAINYFKFRLKEKPEELNTINAYVNESNPDIGIIPLEQILKLIQELPGQYQIVFCLYELDDFSHSEIANLLEIKESTSKSNLHRAKQILRSKINSINNINTNQ